MDIQIQNQQGSFKLNVAFKGSEKGITALYGPSGSGKTSIIDIVAGLRRPETGRVVINNLCLFDSKLGIDLPPERRRIGYVFQDSRLFPHLSVRSNLLFGMRLTPPEKQFIQLEKVTEVLAIKHLLNRRPSKLSGGEKQRVAIGRALLTNPALMLMDEPLNSLDSQRKEELTEFILKLSSTFSVPILYVTHAIEEIKRLASHLVIIRDGVVSASGDLPEILAHPDLNR